MPNDFHLLRSICPDLLCRGFDSMQKDDNDIFKSWLMNMKLIAIIAIDAR